MSSDDRDQRATLVTAQVAAYVPAAAGNTQACLVIIYGGELGRRIPLGFEAIECGRSEKVAIPIDDDAASRRHARIRRMGDTFVVTDLGSTNGTYVNDTLVHERPLVDGDQIKIGRTIFKFIQGSDIELLYHEQIYRVMTYDGLTQVCNRRTFDATLEREMSRAKRYARLISLVLFDIDHFKDHAHHLVVARLARAHFTVRRVRRHPRRVAHHRREHAGHLPEFLLRAPEAAHSEHRQLHPEERRRERRLQHEVPIGHRHPLAAAGEGLARRRQLELLRREIGPHGPRSCPLACLLASSARTGPPRFSVDAPCRGLYAGACVLFSALSRWLV